MTCTDYRTTARTRTRPSVLAIPISYWYCAGPGPGATRVATADRTQARLASTQQMLDSHEPARARSRAAAWSSGPRPPSQHGSRRITDIVPGIQSRISCLGSGTRGDAVERGDATRVSSRVDGAGQAAGACQAPAQHCAQTGPPCPTSLSHSPTNADTRRGRQCRVRRPRPFAPPPSHARGGTTMTWRCTAGASAAATSSSICSSRYGPSPGREARRLRSHESRRLIFQRRGA